VKQIVSIELC